MGDTEDLYSAVFFNLRPRICLGHRKTCWKPHRKGFYPTGQTLDQGCPTPWARILLDCQQRSKNQWAQDKFCSLVQLQLTILFECMDIECSNWHHFPHSHNIPSHSFPCFFLLPSLAGQDRAWRNHFSEPEVEGLRKRIIGDACS